MTKAEVFTQILHEVTGRPLQEVQALLNEATATTGRGGFDEELGEAEAAALLKELRGDKEGIMNWLREGTRAVQQTGTA